LRFAEAVGMITTTQRENSQLFCTESDRHIKDK
jgi:hypothetical protein